MTALVHTKRPAKVAGCAPWVRMVREPDFEAKGYGLTSHPLKGPFEIFALLASRLEFEEVEVFVAVILDARHQIIAATEVTRGTLNSTAVHPREVFKAAIALGAAAVIIAHNHPSGDPAPSPDDHQITAQLTEAGRLLGIPVMDHVIVGRGRYVSFSESGLMQ